MEKRWEPRYLPRTSSVLEAVGYAEVESNPRYRKVQLEDGWSTWCNIFLWDVTRALGAEVPHWVGDPPHRRELSANGVCLWLRTTGRELGWAKASAEDAQAHALRGGVAVATWENPGGHGHVAIVLPEAGELRIAQAGKTNFSRGLLRHGFGSKPVTFYIFPFERIDAHPEP